MKPSPFEEAVAQRSALTPLPRVLAQRQMPPQIAFAGPRHAANVNGRARNSPPEAAVALLMALAPGAQDEIDEPPASQGDAIVYDLATSSVADSTGSFYFLQLRTAPQQLQSPAMHEASPVQGASRSTANPFLDFVALAAQTHVMRNRRSTPAGGSYTGPGLAPWQLRRVRAFVEANLGNNTSVADLAAQCRLSPSHFGRAFAASTGTPPHKWLLNRRIEQAKALMLGSGDELSHIALDCGFVDQSHFTRVFTRTEGLSPGRWRRMHRDDSHLAPPDYGNSVVRKAPASPPVGASPD